ncbi:hypothetical protein N1851_027150 [Merluccius polli]|uniref:Uncharacterized protein n=1 Tax=Merluccius polli TaxID=89951 RepID=A0AA47MAL2_MERPO|nr:hypothetical protein N1851_027150 [Merluccius polli]
MLQSRVNQDSPTTSRALRNSGRTSSTPGALPPRSFLTTSATSAPEIGGPTPQALPRPCFLTGRRVGGIEEVFEVSLPPIHNVPSRGQQRTVSTIHSVDDALLPPPETPDGGPEPLRSRPEVVLHGLTELLPCPGFCLGNRHSCAPLGLPVPACCLRSPTGQKGPIGLLLQFDGIPHRRCPPAGSGIAATAGTDHLAATALVGRLNNGGVEHGPLGLNVPRLPRYMVKALPEVGVEALSDRRLCQTFPADPHDTFGSASSAPLFARVSKTCGRKSDDTTTKSIIELRPRVSWCQAQTTVRIRPPTRRRREATLSSTGVNSNILAPSRGAISIATPARRLSPVATPEWKRVQPLSRRLVPEPLLCVEPRIGPAKVPAFGPPPSSHCTRPLWPLLLVVSRREGGPTSSFRAVPGRAPPGHQALAAEPHPQAWLQGEAPNLSPSWQLSGKGFTFSLSEGKTTETKLGTWVCFGSICHPGEEQLKSRLCSSFVWLGLKCFNSNTFREGKRGKGSLCEVVVGGQRRTGSCCPL